MKVSVTVIYLLIGSDKSIGKEHRVERNVGATQIVKPLNVRFLSGKRKAESPQAMSSSWLSKMESHLRLASSPRTRANFEAGSSPHSSTVK